jgi:hypothetical protein
VCLIGAPFLPTARNPKFTSAKAVKTGRTAEVYNIRRHLQQLPPDK